MSRRALKYRDKRRGDESGPVRLDPHLSASPRRRAASKRAAREAAETQRRLRAEFYERMFGGAGRP